jgi:hypothetical protein
MFSKKIGRRHNKKNCIMLGCLLHINNGKYVEVGSLQVMKCIFGYVNLVNYFNPNIKHRKGLITYKSCYNNCKNN